MKQIEKKIFEIQKIQSKEYLFIVFSRDVYTMGEYILEVAKELHEKKYQGNVLFDLLLSNGSNDRYYTLIFNGLSFDYKSLKKVDIPFEIHNLSNSYYKNNINLLRTSVLSKNKKMNLLKN